MQFALWFDKRERIRIWRPCCRRQRRGPHKPRRQQRRWWAGPRFLKDFGCKHILGVDITRRLSFKPRNSEIPTCRFKELPPGPSGAGSTKHLQAFFLHLVRLSSCCGTSSLLLLSQRLGKEDSTGKLCLMCFDKSIVTCCGATLPPAPTKTRTASFLPFSLFSPSALLFLTPFPSQMLQLQCKHSIVVLKMTSRKGIRLNCYCWGNSSIPEGWFSKWF